MEITLTREGDVYFGGKFGYYTSICRESTRRLFDIPKHNNVIHAVFTKTDMDFDNSFEIIPGMMDGDKAYYGYLDGTRARMLNSCKRILAKMYNKGYRYVHIEYAE